MSQAVPPIDILRRAERAHIAAWPAKGAEIFDGWLYRSAGGGSRRANSVATLSFSGDNTEAAIEAMEARYRAAGRKAVFHTYPFSAPADLTVRLQRRGYTLGESTITMGRTVPTPGATMPPSPFRIEATQTPTPQWLDVYLSGIAEDRRATSAAIFPTMPQHHMAFAAWRDDRAIASAMGVISEGIAVVECVMTRSEARRQGAAEATLLALGQWAAEEGADYLALQVVASNAGARKLYQRLGYAEWCENQFWHAP